LEKLAETLSIERLPSLAEQISGTSSVAHAAACCQAIEKAAGAHIPPAASRIRTILMELERLYNHIGDVGNLCAGTGLSYGSAQGALIKERLLQLNERITGSRFLRKMCRPGGVNRDITTVQREDLLRTLDDMERDFGYLTDFLMTSSSHLDRLETTGRLERKVAEDLGVVGVAARASGILMDTRLDHPYGEYGQISFKPALRAEGDVFARNAVRISEAASSLQILREVIQGMSPQSDELAMEIGEIEPYRSAIGYTETPRGETIHFLMTGPDRSVFRYKVRTPSYCNWPAVPFLFEGNIVPDFPLCNKSLNLSYAGIDL
jgi:Ni,Fe-hydrogenase III large subunit